MTKVHIGFKTVLRIPYSWSIFTFNGIVYRQDDAGRWVSDRAWRKSA